MLTSHFKESQRATTVTYAEERKEDWKCDQLHSLFAVEKPGARKEEMKRNITLDLTVCSSSPSTVKENCLFSAVTTNDTNRHRFS